MSEIRRITITGGANVLTGSDTGSTAATTTRRNRTKKVVQPLMRVVVEEQQVPAPLPQPLKGGATALPNTTKTIQITTETITGAGQSTDSVATPAHIPQNLTGVATGTPATLTGKVVLGGKKPRNLKVLLTKKNHDTGSQQQQQQSLTGAVASAVKNRKVTLGLQHLKRRVTKARRLQKMTKTAPIEQIRKELIAAKIIKEDSKAPDAILRQMYSDAKLVTTKSL